MSSMNDLIRQAKLMTDDERAELRVAGFRPEVIESLMQRGFRPCEAEFHDMLYGETRTGFLRQTRLPHLHIALNPGDDLEDVDTAIHEAGFSAGADHLAAPMVRFLDSLKHRRRVADLSALEQRVKLLEKGAAAVTVVTELT